MHAKHLNISILDDPEQKAIIFGTKFVRKWC